jgi:hypothetical protein
MVATIGSAFIGGGCGYAVTSSDGKIFRPCEATPDALSSALAASAARDLPCASDNLEVTHLEPERAYAVTGCGSRVVYRVQTPSVMSKRIELLSRSTMMGNSSPRSADARM